MLLTIPAGQERVRGDVRVVPESVHGRGGESEGGEEVAGGQEEDQDVTDITTSPLSHTDRSQASVNQISTERERAVPCIVDLCPLGDDQDEHHVESNWNRKGVLMLLVLNIVTCDNGHWYVETEEDDEVLVTDGFSWDETL